MTACANFHRWAQSFLPRVGNIGNTHRDTANAIRPFLLNELGFGAYAIGEMLMSASGLIKSRILLPRNSIARRAISMGVPRHL